MSIEFLILVSLFIYSITYNKNKIFTYIKNENIYTKGEKTYL